MQAVICIAGVDVAKAELVISTDPDSNAVHSIANNEQAIAAWLQKDLKPFVDQYLDDAFIIRQNIFNNAEVQRIRQAFYNGKKERAEKIWFLLMFQMWYDRWMNNN